MNTIYCSAERFAPTALRRTVFNLRKPLSVITEPAYRPAVQAFFDHVPLLPFIRSQKTVLAELEAEVKFGWPVLLVGQLWGGRMPRKLGPIAHLTVWLSPPAGLRDGTVGHVWDEPVGPAMQKLARHYRRWWHKDQVKFMTDSRFDLWH
jgi:hypothetical protein